MRRTLPTVTACLVACAALVAHARHRLPFLADDALISLRYTDRLLSGHGLTWTAGEAVEGYSNLLWVLLAAVPGLLGMDLVDGLRGLGVACCAAVVVALIWPHRDRLSAWTVAALFFAAAGPVAVWAVGGLEAPLVAALLAWALVPARRLADGRGERRTLACGLPLGLLAITRPDGVVLAVAVVAGVLAARPGRRRAAPRAALGLAARLLAPALALLAGQLVFRLLYYGDWLPNTAYAKLGFTWQRVGEGAAHVGAGLVDVWPLALLGMAGLLAAAMRPGTRAAAWPALVPLVVWPLYVATVGGDVFPAYRHLLPVAVPLCWGIGLGLEILLAGRRRWPAAAAALLVVTAFGVWQWHHAEYRRAAETRFVWWGKDIALTLKRAFADRDPLLAASAAGCLPYYTEFRSLDILGLCDRHIARNRPVGFGTGPLAHELGDVDYVLDRRPDILMIGAPGPGAGRELGGVYGRDLLADPRFLRDYRSVRLGIDAAEPFTCYAWLRLAGRPLGRLPTPGGADVPAYFCNGNAATVARLDAADRLVIAIDPETPAYLRLGDDVGRITRVELVPPSPGVTTEVFADEQGARWLGLASERRIVVERIRLAWE